MLITLSPTSLPVDQFREELNAICGAFEVLPGADRSVMRGAVAHEVRGGFDVAHVAKDAQCIRRGRSEIARDSAEHCFLVVQEEGRALMSQHESVSMLRPGDMVLIDSTEPSEFTFFGYSRQLSVHLPREQLKSRFGDALRGGLHLPRTDHTTLAIAAVLAKALQTQHNALQSGCLEEALYGLLGSMLFADGTAVRRIDADVGHAQLLARAVAYIDASHADSGLTPARMAADLKTSSRQLQRAFATLGTTPTEYLLQQRLASACRALLQSRATEGKPLISTIAYGVGFNDLSYFNRIFRATFGCTPSQYAVGGAG
ncbi:MAG: helix-turn-helix domain-containing protein [Sphaerotilus natans subsp. sulfidivorans]|uniref:helix-turn-helix domain-containing protein n=1 Tax=Sphaerotilus sulfidivorans TaxID=639200 RepID=UPI002354D2C0|nr:helix-turn-helix domain-containing protein [Sphaerotilus sulfidivorans]MCK6401324.1 helix-turn-helix domain-containing protein [Sphaerotilus sulfidivorans]